MNGTFLFQYLAALFLFYTWINILLVAAYKWTSKYIDLHLSCLIVAFVSFGISYIHPRIIKLVVNEKCTYTFDVRDKWGWLNDFIVHWIPLIFVFMVVPISNNLQLISRTFAFIILYLLITKAPYLYNFDTPLSMILCITALIVRLALIV